MIAYLFIVTIVYQALRIVCNIVRYLRKTKETEGTLEQKMGLTGAILLRVGAISLAAVGLLVGGTAAIGIAIVLAIACVMMTILAATAFGYGKHSSIVIAAYNYIMMMLFVWCIYKGLK
ncbi:MAG: hypothetical protein IKN15_01220 [Bacteroidaceae bacterium]|nr:hypothetical protein [Bacteroidaceae bacterium]